jgi:hypothetical protein
MVQNIDVESLKDQLNKVLVKLQSIPELTEEIFSELLKTDDEFKSLNHWVQGPHLETIVKKFRYNLNEQEEKEIQNEYDKLSVVEKETVKTGLKIYQIIEKVMKEKVFSSNSGEHIDKFLNYIGSQ